MSEINTGGSAFPNSSVQGDYVEGMTLRDYFAGQAVIGLLCAKLVELNPSDMANACYQYADVMLKAREEKL